MKNCEYWGIFEIQNGQFKACFAPYTSEEKAFEHCDKLLIYRKANPNPIHYEYRVQRIYHPSFVG